MPAGVATLVFTAVIFCLFWLDRDPEPRVSPALWIPIAWLAQAGSRLASEWMMGSDAVQVGSTALSSDRYMEGSPIDRFILSSLLIAGFLVLVARRERAGAFLRANGAILLFFLYCGASVLWSDYPDVAFKRWTKALAGLVSRRPRRVPTGHAAGAASPFTTVPRPEGARGHRASPRRRQS